MEYSLTSEVDEFEILLSCLNPYSNGILSDYLSKNIPVDRQRVLILILMEYSLTW